jgi:hypothetical protein
VKLNLPDRFYFIVCGPITKAAQDYLKKTAPPNPISSESGSENQGATVNSPSENQARTLAVSKQTTRETTND